MVLLVICGSFIFVSPIPGTRVQHMGVLSKFSWYS